MATRDSPRKIPSRWYLPNSCLRAPRRPKRRDFLLIKSRLIFRSFFSSRIWRGTYTFITSKLASLNGRYPLVIIYEFIARRSTIELCSNNSNKTRGL